MNSALCSRLGIGFPLFAFSHCRDVVAAVSRAGGFGVLGATAHTLDSLEEELRWIDGHAGGPPSGRDVLTPDTRAAGAGGAALMGQVPDAHRAFVADLAARHGVTIPEGRSASAPTPFDPELAMRMLEVGFRHPIKLIANALGVPPPEMIAMGRAHGVPVAALVGAREHAVRQARAGVDIIVAQGGEAGGHCGEVSTMVLVPEVIRATAPYGDIPVLAAGGIVTGSQMAAAMAMGAAGAWTGTVWLATPESEVSEVVKEKILAAGSRDAVRSRGRTGKPSRQLRSTWTAAWDAPDSPAALPMPLQSLISEPALRAADRAAIRGEPAARALFTYWAGQGVGLIDHVRGAGQIVQDFKLDFAEACDRLAGLTTQ